MVGERRYLAWVDLGHVTIWVKVRTVEEHQRLLPRLVENIQREDLNPFEQADCFRLLLDEHGMSEEELAATIGKDPSDVSRALTIASGIRAEMREEYCATSHKPSASILVEATCLVSLTRARNTDTRLRMSGKVDVELTANLRCG